MGDPDVAAGHVFLCYAREDSARVDELEGLLRSGGMRVWRDTEQLWPGQDWRVHIRRAIADGALAFLACFSRAGMSREARYQNMELVLAAEQLRLRAADVTWLIPVRLDDCDIPDLDLDLGGGRTLAGLHSADLFGPGAHKSGDRLVEAVRRIVRTAAAAGVTTPAGEAASTVLPPPDPAGDGDRHQAEPSAAREIIRLARRTTFRLATSRPRPPRPMD